MICKYSFFLTVVLLLFKNIAIAQSNKDSLEIQRTIRNFIEGWYEGDPERMEASLHEELISKIVISENGNSRLGIFTASKLIELTDKGGGKDVPKDKQRKDIVILEIYQNVATARVLAYDAMELLHLAKWNEEWKIINILFERAEKY